MFVVQIFLILVRVLHLIAVYCSEEVMFARSSEDCRKGYDNSFDSFIIPTQNFSKVLFSDSRGTDSVCTSKEM